MKTRDIDIRTKLHYDLDCEYAGDKNTRILDELGLCQGEARIDVAVINGSLHGYEIKSESDTLERLPDQIEIYCKVLDLVTIVSGENHINNILSMVPKWWGIDIAEMNNNGEVAFSNVRKPSVNQKVDARSLVQLLWREEALNLLKHYGLEKGYKSKSKRIIWEKLVESFSLDELKYHVRETLKHRKNWRAD